jgi:hypothetical protein
VCLMNVLQPVRLTAPGLRCDEPVLPGRLPASVGAPSAHGGAISRSMGVACSGVSRKFALTSALKNWGPAISGNP